MIRWASAAVVPGGTHSRSLLSNLAGSGERHAVSTEPAIETNRIKGKRFTSTRVLSALPHRQAEPAASAPLWRGGATRVPRCFRGNDPAGQLQIPRMIQSCKIPGTLLSCWSELHKLAITSTRINSMKSIPTQTQVMNAKRDARLAQRRVQRRELSASATQRKSLEEKAKLKRARKMAKQAKKTAKRAIKEVAQARLELEEARERLRRAEKKAGKAAEHDKQKTTPSAANGAKPFAQKRKSVPMAEKANPFLARRRGAVPMRPDMKRPSLRSAGKPARGLYQAPPPPRGKNTRTNGGAASESARDEVPGAQHRAGGKAGNFKKAGLNGAPRQKSNAGQQMSTRSGDGHTGANECQLLIRRSQTASRQKSRRCRRPSSAR